MVSVEPRPRSANIEGTNLEPTLPEKPRRRLASRMRGAWGLWLALLIAASFGVRVVRLDTPSDYAIFDEIYYLNAARVILGLPPQSAGQNLTRVGVPIAARPYTGSPPGIDPNSEHPPLGKLILALSLWGLGDTPVAWRLPAAILGTLAILCVFGLARALRAPPALALLAAFLFGFDNMVFVLSRVGMLDIGMLAFLLAGCWAYLGGRPVLAGIALGLSTLVKLTGVDGVLALFVFEACCGLSWWLRRRAAGEPAAVGAGEELARTPRFGHLAVMTVCYLATFMGLLWFMDSRWTLFENPGRHVQYMVQQAARLERPRGPLYDESYPWQWLANDVEINFFKREVDVRDVRPPTKRTIIFFRGAMNPFIIGVLPLALAGALYLSITSAGALPLFSLALFAGTFLTDLPPAIFGGRIEYIYYFATAMPAVALAAAQLFRRFLPGFMTWAFAAAVLFGFYEYFPFRDLAMPWLFNH